MDEKYDNGSLLNSGSVADRRAAYLAGTPRSIGRGGHHGNLLPDLNLIVLLKSKTKNRA